MVGRNVRDDADEWERARCLVDDEAFDALLPEWAQRVSRGNFTPLAIARRAVDLLVGEPGARVLDVGSGVGKVCVVGALTTLGRFDGVEQRAHFVEAARGVATRLGARRARFHCANMTEIDWRPYRSFYLFNPFAEYYDTLLEPFEPEVPIDRELHESYVRHVRGQLELAPTGTRVVTYNGFGGELPFGYRLVTSEPAANDRLELWVRTV